MTATATSALSVLFVEDEIMIRMMVVEMLEELGHRVAAETGEIDQAIRLAQNTEFDLPFSMSTSRAVDYPGCGTDYNAKPPDHFCDRLWHGRHSRRISGPSQP